MAFGLGREWDGTNKVIGYVIPWPLGFGDTIPGRVCVKCYAARGGPRDKPLTRESVTAEIEKMRAEGLGNFGGADYCWVCLTSFLTGKRVSRLREIKPGEHKVILPPPPAPGDSAQWYLTHDPGRFYCRHCQDYEWEEPGVIQYYDGAETLSFGEELLEHGGTRPAYFSPETIAKWREKGWLAWFSCDNCGWVSYKAVSQKQIEKWGRDCGGWHLRKTKDGEWIE